MEEQQKVEKSKFEGAMIQLELEYRDCDPSIIKPDFYPGETFWNRYKLGGNKNFALFIGIKKRLPSTEITKEEDIYNALEQLEKDEIIKVTKDEDENEVMLLSLDKFLNKVYDWHELIMSDDDLEKAGYAFILHARSGQINMYIKVFKGILYSSFIDYMYGRFVENFKEVKNLQDVVASINETANEIKYVKE